MLKLVKRWLKGCEHNWRKDMDWIYDNKTVDISCRKCKKLKNITIEEWRKRYDSLEQK